MGAKRAQSGYRAGATGCEAGARRVRGGCEAVARRAVDLGDLGDPSEHAELEAEAIFSIPADLNLKVLAVDHPAARPAGHLGCTRCVICRGSTLALYQHHAQIGSRWLPSRDCLHSARLPQTTRAIPWQRRRAVESSQCLQWPMLLQPYTAARPCTDCVHPGRLPDSAPYARARGPTRARPSPHSHACLCKCRSTQAAWVDKEPAVDLCRPWRAAWPLAA